MSLITQCPTCATMFRVVPDQLRISDGWVRCGQCDEVFDANAHLRKLEERVVTAAPEPLGANTAQSHPEPPGELPAEPQPHAETAAPVPLGNDYDWGPDLTDAGQAAQAPLQDSWEQDPASQPLAWEATQYAGIVPLRAEPEPDPEPIADDRLQAMAEDPAPSFMGSARTSDTAAGTGPGRRSLVVWCSLLGLLLASQVVMLQRDRIAATAPALRPWLQAACTALGCGLAPPREIEAISIDSSAFTSVRPGVYLLQLSLKNAATMAVATPALELTLTDAQDRALLRRVLLPAQLSSMPSVEAGAEWVASLPISVTTEAAPGKIAGYKLFAFYP